MQLRIQEVLFSFVVVLFGFSRSLESIVSEHDHHNEYKGKFIQYDKGGDEDFEGGLRKFLDTRKGGSEKIRGGGLRKFVYFKTNRKGGLLKN